MSSLRYHPCRSVCLSDYQRITTWCSAWLTWKNRRKESYKNASTSFAIFVRTYVTIWEWLIGLLWNLMSGSLTRNLSAQSRDVHRNVCSLCHNIQRGVHRFLQKSVNHLKSRLRWDEASSELCSWWPATYRIPFEGRCQRWHRHLSPP